MVFVKRKQKICSIRRGREIPCIKYARKMPPRGRTWYWIVSCIDEAFYIEGNYVSKNEREQITWEYLWLVNRLV